MQCEPGSLFPAFDRKFLPADGSFSVIGAGELGGKALGLAFVHRLLAERWNGDAAPGLAVNVPTLTVLATGVFEQFMEQNGLWELADSDAPDARIANAFQRAELPALVVGDLRALIADLRSPLAIRSSSRLEDALAHPLAGTYATKMIPNNQADEAIRFQKLVEGIKFVYASTFFRDARSYLHAIGRDSREERMAIIIQEVVGQRFGDRFYPTVSGVIRTFNFYPTGPGRPEDGMAALALGLGKTIVDGGMTWTYCPAFPQHGPPFGSVRDLVRGTQTDFWAVHMGPPPPYDPISETEYLVRAGLAEAELDGALPPLVSTYDPESDRLMLGMGRPGPRVLTFAPLLELGDVPLNTVVQKLGGICRDAVGSDVEIEFAVTLRPAGRGQTGSGLPGRFGFLQLRPLRVAHEPVPVDPAELESPGVLVATTNVLGHGRHETIAVAAGGTTVFTPGP